MKAKLCGYAGCNRLTENNHYYCNQHKQIAENKKKESAFKSAKRFADYSLPEWRALSKKVLQKNNYCSACGITGVKLQVHHVVPVRYAPERFLDESNCIVLCSQCHAIETQKEIFLRNRFNR